MKFDINEPLKSDWFTCSATKEDCDFSCDHDGLLLGPESQYIDPIMVEKCLVWCVWNDDSVGLISLSHEIRKILSAQADLKGNAASGLQESVDQSIGSRLLHFACKLDSVECAAALLNGECGLTASTSEVDENGRTPLHNAAKEHSIRCIELLLQKAARTDFRSKDNIALIPLEVALLSARLQVDWTPNETVERLLYLLNEKDLNAVRLLMVKTRELPKVVFITAMEGRVVALAVLLMVDADRVNALKMLPTITTSGLCEESTVYECVIRETIALGRIEVEQVGLSSCRVNPASSMNWSEKRKALLCEMELLQLFGAAARGSCTDRRTASPLISVCEAGDEAVMKLLLKTKIDINETDKDGNSAIHWCLRGSPYSKETRFRLVSLLLRHGARVSQKNKLGLTPVHVAAGNGNFQVLQLLLLWDPNCVDVASETKETPLFFAVKSNSMECVQLLLSYGANTQSFNLCKERPIDLTKSQDMRFILNTTNPSFCNHVVPIQETDRDTKEGFLDAKQHISCERVCTNAKTELCRYYGSPSGCARGSKCYFAHGEAELNQTNSGSAELKLGLSSQAIGRNLSKRTLRVSEDLNKKIFIGGLPPFVDSGDLRVYFEKEFGAVEDAVVIRSQAGDHVQSRGFGFVTFKSETAVAAAVRAHFVNILGKKVEIKGAVPKVVSFHEFPKTSRQQQEEHRHLLNSSATEAKDEGRQEPMSCVEKIIAIGMQTTDPDMQMVPTQNIPQWLETFKRWLPSFLTEASKRLLEGECYPLSSLKGDFRATCGMELDHASLGYPKLSEFMRSFSGICRMKIVPVGKGPATHVVLLPSWPQPHNQPHLESQILFKESKSKPFYDYVSLPIQSCNSFPCTRSWYELGNKIDASFLARTLTVSLDNVECEGSGVAGGSHGQGDDVEREGSGDAGGSHGQGDDVECEGSGDAGGSHGQGDNVECEGPGDAGGSRGQGDSVDCEGPDNAGGMHGQGDNVECEGSGDAGGSCGQGDNVECKGSGNAGGSCGQRDLETSSSFSVDPALLSLLEPGYSFLRPWHTPPKKTGDLGPWQSPPGVPFSYFVGDLGFFKETFLREKSICVLCNEAKALWAVLPCKHKLMCSPCKMKKESSWRSWTRCVHCSQPVGKFFYQPWSGYGRSDGQNHSPVFPACESNPSFPPLPSRDSSQSQVQKSVQKKNVRGSGKIKPADEGSSSMGSGGGSSDMCLLCKEKTAKWITVPCEHKLFCSECKSGQGKTISKCLVCNEPVEKLLALNR